jgi:hypothetical protein
MAEATIVAARIHGALAGGLGAAHGAARMTPVSEGSGQNPVIAYQDRATRQAMFARDAHLSAIDRNGQPRGSGNRGDRPLRYIREFF